MCASIICKKRSRLIKAQAYIEEQPQKATAEATRKKAELEANLHALRLEGAAAAAAAEANVLEAAAENEQGELDRASLKNEYVHGGSKTRASPGFKATRTHASTNAQANNGQW